MSKLEEMTQGFQQLCMQHGYLQVSLVKLRRQLDQLSKDDQALCDKVRGQRAELEEQAAKVRAEVEYTKSGMKRCTEQAVEIDDAIPAARELAAKEAAEAQPADEPKPADEEAAQYRREIDEAVKKMAEGKLDPAQWWADKKKDMAKKKGRLSAYFASQAGEALTQAEDGGEGENDDG